MLTGPQQQLRKLLRSRISHSTRSRFRLLAWTPTRLSLLRAGGLLAASLLVAPGAAVAATFTATLDRDTVAVGESAALTLTFEGGDPESISRVDIPNLQIESRGTSRNFSLANGKASSSTVQTYILTPTQPGDYTIPAIQARVSGQTLSSEPLKLKVVKPGPAATDAASGDKIAFVKLFVPRKEVYAGEVVTIEVQVFLRNNIANAEAIMQSIDNFNGTPIKAEGFSILKTGHAAHRQARVGNGLYSVATLVTAVSPIKTGPLTLNSMEFPLPLRILAANQPRTDPFFDPFGTFARYEQKNVNLVAEPETVTALALPGENVPPSFNGAVGNFTMTASAGPTNVATGDPITIKVQLAGRGALDSLNLPENADWRDFKTYPPTTKVEAIDALGLQGSKTFEQVVVPQSTTIKAIPELAFSFFDPEQKVYRTLTRAPIPIIVRPGGVAVATLPAAAPANRKQENAPAAQDIVPIKDRLGAVAQIGPPLVMRPWFLALQAVPLLVFASAFIWRRRADAFANNPRLRRERMTELIVRNGLAELRKFAAENKSDQFFATLFRLLQEQIGERLDLPASAITEAVIDEHLRPRDVPESVIAPVQELFQMCNLARYAPIKSSQELAAIIPKFEAVSASLKGLKL